eukprot:5902796-Heterocapsa_arctica.AAC.1
MPVKIACRFWGVLASYSVQSRRHTSRPLPSQPSLVVRASPPIVREKKRNISSERRSMLT